MQTIEKLSELICCDTVEDWRDLVFRMGCDLGYEKTRLAILPDPHAPIEAEHAFQHSNYSSDWLNKYTADKLHHFDPTFLHCLSKSTPLIWSPDIFSGHRQKEMYEEASGYGIRSGVTLPIHGASGELGIVCFVSDTKPDKHFHNDANRNLPELCCFRDFILESSLKFMKPSGGVETPISVTRRELECLKWCAAGKSSWEIGQILHCAEPTVNFHFNNIRRKFNTNSRQQAVVRAIKLGLIHPA
jgi:LuxR family quorum-sensing transcriptional regulator LasR